MSVTPPIFSLLPPSLFFIILVNIMLFLCYILFLVGFHELSGWLQINFFLLWTTSTVLRTKVRSGKHPSSTLPAPLVLWTAVPRAWPVEVIVSFMSVLLNFAPITSTQYKSLCTLICFYVHSMWFLLPTVRLGFLIRGSPLGKDCAVFWDLVLYGNTGDTLDIYHTK